MGLQNFPGKLHNIIPSMGLQNFPGKLHNIIYPQWVYNVSLENFITSYPQWVYNVPGKLLNIIPTMENFIFHTLQMGLCLWKNLKFAHLTNGFVSLEKSHISNLNQKTGKFADR
jgi:hypothetical protein